MSDSRVGPPAFSERLALLEAAVRSRTDARPRLGLVLGSGLGGIGGAVEAPLGIPFAELPGWPPASAPGHAGQLLFGRLEGAPVVCQQGRLHLYEGVPERLVVEPVLLMARLGARAVVLTNAAGGVNASFGAGTLMVIRDHLNLTGRNPLVGPGEDALGPRFPDLSTCWDPDLTARLFAAGAAEGVRLAEGVYAGLLGPNYETSAEIRMLQRLGADAVGMSTVLEAVVARWAGLRVCGVSLVTNPGAGLTDEPITHEDVVRAAAEAGPRLVRVLRRFARELAAEGALG